jgi:hypothetical protein
MIEREKMLCPILRHHPPPPPWRATTMMFFAAKIKKVSNKCRCDNNNEIEQLGT